MDCPQIRPLEQGLITTPWVNYEQIDYAALATDLERLFACGENVRVRMANEAIDHVTADMRFRTSRDADFVMCEDFAQSLFDATRGKKPVIDVRDAWKPLYKWHRRDHAPPPCVLIFIVEGTFEAAMVWIHQACLRLSIKAMQDIFGNPEDI